MGGLFGRDEECGRLREVLDHADKGMSGVLVLRGAPGAGKSALLDHVEALAATQEFEVMRFYAVESEAELGFAALHQLLRPYVAQLGQPPSPQGDALARVFGLQERTSAPDRFLVALVALGLLAARPGTRPLLCLADDAHWLDQESAEALSFIARRLYADSVAMVFAVRDGHVDHGHGAILSVTDGPRLQGPSPMIMLGRGVLTRARHVRSPGERTRRPLQRVSVTAALTFRGGTRRRRGTTHRCRSGTSRPGACPGAASDGRPGP
ncbi:AAA family ATPase [Streptomyces sp. NPDC002573]|uniref:AAA family ATPase n=1 Tax=Streptomyces sp. NPDC002573 TaxID=3364651 RepID=UPI00367E3435